MEKLLTLFLLIIFLIGCNNRTLPPCSCCENAYVNLDDAFKCIDDNPPKTSYDDRLFLIAFTNLKNKGWGIIEDPEIIAVAKRNYLLIVANKNEINSYDKATPELKGLIKKYKGQELFFIVANQALYPFRDWGGNESKKRIISELQVGNGP